MKALIYESPGQVRFEEVPEPVPEPHEAIVQIMSAGICGTDLHAVDGQDRRRHVPFIFGHEAAGFVAEGPYAGRRVVINPLETCMNCENCVSGRTNVCAKRTLLSLPPKPGVFAERVALARGNLVSISDDMSYDQAALCAPLACGWHAARLARRAVPWGRRALVIGGGAVGLGGALSLVAQGVEDVTILDANPKRASYLQDTCGQTVVAQSDLTTVPDFDLILDSVGLAATRDLACAHTNAGGVIAHIGFSEARDGLDIRHMTLNEITFIGSYAFTAQDFRTTATAMEDGRFGPLTWFETRALAEGQAAFDALRAGTVAAPRLILRPSEH